MSNSVHLIDDDGSILVSKNKIAEGGTFVANGTNDCELSITYNYSPLYYEVFPDDEGLRWLETKRGKESITILEKAVERLGTKRDSSYWNATMGNAGFSLSILLGWAKEFPNGKFAIY